MSFNFFSILLTAASNVATANENSLTLKPKILEKEEFVFSAEESPIIIPQLYISKACKFAGPR